MLRWVWQRPASQSSSSASSGVSFQAWLQGPSGLEPGQTDLGQHPAQSQLWGPPSHPLLPWQDRQPSVPFSCPAAPPLFLGQQAGSHQISNLWTWEGSWEQVSAVFTETPGREGFVLLANPRSQEDLKSYHLPTQNSYPPQFIKMPMSFNEYP